MDYEKEYKDAMERAKKWGLTHKLCIEDIFPELAESEDERTRKELLEEIESIIPHEDETDSEGLILPSYHTRIDRYKSYLEKQKEPTTEELYAEAGTTEKEYIANTMKMVRAMREKKKEQKPDTRDADDLQLLGFIYDLLNEIEWKDSWAMSKDECLRLLSNYSPQKPAEWSDYMVIGDGDCIAECLPEEVYNEWIKNEAR